MSIFEEFAVTHIYSITYIFDLSFTARITGICTGADPVFLDRGFIFAKGVRFDNFVSIFSKFITKLK